jgi:nucleoside-diphosphate kinase
MLAEERTFVAVKPDGVQRGLIGEITSRFERKGFKILGMKLLSVSEKQATQHYAEHVGKPFYERLVKYIMSGPIVAMVIKGYGAVESVRHIVGATNPLKADVGTIRADFAQVMEYNVVHASDSIESAEREIAIYFNEDEIFDNWKTKTEELIEEDELL